MAEREVCFSVKVRIHNDNVDEITDEMVEELDLFPSDGYYVNEYYIEQSHGLIV